MQLIGTIKASEHFTREEADLIRFVLDLFNGEIVSIRGSEDGCD